MGIFSLLFEFIKNSFKPNLVYSDIELNCIELKALSRIYDEHQFHFLYSFTLDMNVRFEIEL